MADSRNFWRSCSVLAFLFILCGAAWGAERQRRDLPKCKDQYVLILPKGHAAGKTYDLVVALHGAGDNAENFANFWQPQVAGRETVLAVPQGGSKQGAGANWNTGDLDKVVEVVEDCAKNFGVDPKRVLLTGHSAGCCIGFHIISKRPELFACFGGTANAVQKQVVDLKEFEKAADKVAIYYAVGKQDPNYPAYARNVELFKRLKFNFVAEDPDVGHTVTPDECKKMLELFDSTADRAGRARLAEIQKLLAARSWAAAEKGLTELAAGKGAVAADAHTALETLHKDMLSKFDAARSLPGPEAVMALKQFSQDYAGTALAAEALKFSEQIARDPKTAELAQQKKKDAAAAQAQEAFDKAETLEKSGKPGPALEAYGRVSVEFPDTPAKTKAEAAVARMKADPKTGLSIQQAEAEKLLRQAENLLRNQMAADAKQLFQEIAAQYPATEAGKKAKEKAAALP